MRPSRIIRYPVDLISVLVVLSTVSLQVFAVIRNWPWYAVILIVLLLRQVSLVEHNHAHLTIFTARFSNILLGWLCHLLHRRAAGYLSGPPRNQSPSP
jgi:hypothetical protein